MAENKNGKPVDPVNRSFRKVERVVYPQAKKWGKEGEILEGILFNIVSVTLGKKSCEIATVICDGINIPVWISTGLKGLNNIATGTYIRITYEGVFISPSSGENFKKFLVEYDTNTVATEPF